MVAFGTSAPALAVSVQAACAGSGDLAVGSLVGNNIANVLLILGLAALVAPITVFSKQIQFDVPLVIGASLLLFGRRDPGLEILFRSRARRSLEAGNSAARLATTQQTEYYGAVAGNRSDLL